MSGASASLCWGTSADSDSDADSVAGSAHGSDGEDGLLEERPAFEPRFIDFITNRRGEELALYEWPVQPSVRGVCLLFHGFMASAGRLHPLAEALSRLGLLCYGADMVGHGASHGATGTLPSSAGLLEDGLDVLSFVRSRHPGARIFVCGCSMGGAIAASVAQHAGQAVEGVVLLSPLVRPSSDTWPAVALMGLLRMFSCLGCSSASTLLDLAEVLLDRVDLFDHPFFLALGSRDNIIDHSGIGEFYDRARTEPRAKIFKVYHGADHTLLKSRPHLQGRILGDVCHWIDAHLQREGRS